MEDSLDFKEAFFSNKTIIKTTGKYIAIGLIRAERPIRKPTSAKLDILARLRLFRNIKTVKLKTELNRISVNNLVLKWIVVRFMAYKKAAIKGTLLDLNISLAIR